MSAAKHTPGPWQVGPVFDNYGTLEVIIEHMTPAGNLVVAVALGGLAGQDANAHLMAAAPDLLEALRDLEAMAERYRPPGNSMPDAQKKARAAIAKAEGGAA